MKPDFPQSWLTPEAPAYGMFPYPFAKRYWTRMLAARGSSKSLMYALKAGCRHIDTAYTYGNQHQIGEVVRRSKIPREDLYVTSKLHPGNNNYIQAAEKIREAIALIWRGSDFGPNPYLDEFLIHYPGFGNPTAAWRALIEARDARLVRHIGVSNFEVRHLEQLALESGVVPEVNQIEFHPWIYHAQEEILKYCRAHGIALEGYSPLVQGETMADSDLQSLASIHATTPARVLLRWCMQHGVKPIVGTHDSKHIVHNFAVYDFELMNGEIVLLNGKSQHRTIRISEKWNWYPQRCALGEYGHDGR